MNPELVTVCHALSAAAFALWLAGRVISMCGRDYGSCRARRRPDGTYQMRFYVDGVEETAIGQRDAWVCRWTGEPMPQHATFLHMHWAWEERDRHETEAARRANEQSISSAE